MGRSPKPTRVAYELIDPQSDSIPYRLLHDLVAAHHDHLRGARIALAWCTSWKADVDGRVTLGQCRKSTDLDRELTAYDFVILLNHAFWTEPLVGEYQRRALLDHELCHAEVRLNKYGEPATDERGRRVYRIRKHDLEEFRAIVERYGCYKRDLEDFAAVLRRGAQLALPDPADVAEPVR